MKLKSLLTCTALMIAACNSTFGQTDFFWSTSPLNSGATNEDVTLELEPGESGTLYLYYTTNGPADSDLNTGAFLDVMTSESGVIELPSNRKKTGGEKVNHVEMIGNMQNREFSSVTTTYKRWCFYIKFRDGTRKIVKLGKGVFLFLALVREAVPNTAWSEWNTLGR